MAADPLATARRDLASALAGGGGPVDLAPAASRQDLASVIAGAMDPAPLTMMSTGRAPTLRGVGLWLSQRPERQRLLVTRGLPAPHEFFLMFGDGGQGHDAPVDPVPAAIPGDADLLRMFDTAAPTAPQQSPAAQGADVLGLFAPAAPPTAANPDSDETRPGDHDILALFDALPDTGAAEAEKIPPDILDLFGGKPNDDGKPV
jgi:hypothetical protein